MIGFYGYMLAAACRRTTGRAASCAGWPAATVSAFVLQQPAFRRAIADSLERVARAAA